MESQEQMLQQIKIFEKLTDYKSQMGWLALNDFALVFL